MKYFIYANKVLFKSIITNTTSLKDRHATENKTPEEDESQDYKLLGGYSNDTHTVLRFARPWITCDSKNDLEITVSKMIFEFILKYLI